MKRQAMVSVLGTFTFGFALLGLVGCSGDDSDGATPASDAGPGTKDGSIASQDGAANDANTNDSASPTTDGGHDAGCDKAPSLHPAGSARIVRSSTAVRGRTAPPINSAAWPSRPISSTARASPRARVPRRRRSSSSVPVRRTAAAAPRPMVEWTAATQARRTPRRPPRCSAAASAPRRPWTGRARRPISRPRSRRPSARPRATASETAARTRSSSAIRPLGSARPE